jgi:hypothetical protein
MRSRALWGVLALSALGLVFTVVLSAAVTTMADAAVEPGTPVKVDPGVPDQGRSWELVTPPDVVSAHLYFVRALSADGNHVSYMTTGSLPGAPAGAPIPTVNMATRGTSGWSDQPLGAPYPLLGAPSSPYGILYPGPLALSPDLETSIWINYLPLGLGESEKEVGLFRRQPDGTFTLLAEVGHNGGFIGASEDMGHVFFASEQHLLAADATRTAGQSIYEIDGSVLRLADVNGEGALLSDCGSSVLGNEYGDAIDGAISTDGQRVFFSTHPGCSGPSRVYLRQSGTSTTEISASQCDLPDCGPEADVSFVGATPSGSSAFLVSEERLTDEDTNSYPDLYRYDVATGKLTLVSSSPGGVGLAVGSAPVHVSTDGSHVYFYATPQSGPEEGTGQHLYLADQSGLHMVGPAGSEVQISADGRYALLSTNSRLTSGDTDERTDLYRYDAESGTVTPISVEGPAEGNGPFNARTEPTFFAESVTTQPYRSMSEDGSRIFFSTEERLVPQDHNEATDVYEWTNGQLGLISSGESDHPAIYLGATPDGRSVLFRTTDTLLPSDRDGGEMDFYEARIGGGFPEAAAAEGCGGPCASQPQKHADRAVPASAKAGARTIEVRYPGPADRRQIVASGWITLLAEAPKGGRLSAEAQARIGHHVRTIASTDIDISKAGPVHLRMRLSQAARVRLAAGEGLQVRLTLRFAHLPSIRRLKFELKGAP